MRTARFLLAGFAGLLGTLLAVAVLGIAAAWLWTGSDTSLATALAQASRLLPASQSLRADDVRGTLRHGGHIGLLRWENDGLVIEARQVDLVWRPMALLDRRLQLDSVHVGELVIDDRSPAKPASAPDDLSVPFQVDLAFVIDTLRWVGNGGAEATSLKGHYQFDGTAHGLKLDGSRFADGQYKAHATLMARMPLRLDAAIQGELKAVIPGTTQPLPLTATATVKGDLSGGASAIISLDAQLSATGSPAPVKASVVAKVSPWANQPVLRADAVFSSLNLATLWPGAPQTLLTGSLQVAPVGPPVAPKSVTGQDWQAKGEFTNRLSGPWDKARLPADSAQASVRYSNGQWLLESLAAAMAGGRVAASGKLSGKPSGTASNGSPTQWDASVSVQNVNPALIHTALEAVRLDGDGNANWHDDGTDFVARLHPSPGQKATSRVAGFHIKQVTAKGRWAKNLLSLKHLEVQTGDATLQGHVAVQWPEKSLEGDVKLELPGGVALVRGLLGPSKGDGSFSLKVSDATRASNWLVGLPGFTGLMAGYSLRGTADSTGAWAGGWQGDGPAVQVRLRVPEAALNTPATPAGASYILRDVQADLSGRLSGLAMDVKAQAQQGSRSYTLVSRATGRRIPASSGTDWQIALEALRMQMQEGQQAGNWVAETRRPVTVNWQHTDSGDLINISPGEALLTGPAPGSASVVWQPAKWWSHDKNQDISTRGTVQGIPLKWVDLLTSGQMARLGLRGDLTFDGDWNLQSAKTLSATASLRRRSGDIDILLAGDPAMRNGAQNGTAVTAGIREARIDLTMDNDEVTVGARWDTERAGMAQGEFKTRLFAGPGGWRWPAEAPVSGILKATLPQVGAWSMLAPAGWRIRGTLDAAITLAGTRKAPQWSGSLNADSLAVRSIADGIEFNNGKLRTSLVGQRVEIREFSLQGAAAGSSGTGAGTGGTMTASGSAQWLPKDGESSNGRPQVQVDLEIQARALRVSARADRRLVVTGNGQVMLRENGLSIRGDLKADQALFVLPDESTPSLGSDVTVRASGRNSVIKTPDKSDASGVAPNAAPPVATLVPDVAINMDMGSDFRVQGRGLSARLAGTLKLTSSAATRGTPRVTGNLTTVGGTYKAYGQALDIEEGILRFTGPYDNPALDILAIRPNLVVRVGVQVSGTALLPRVRLYAEPEVAEAEKLAWLVLGRSGANGGAESAVLQQAAVALLGGNGQGLSAGLAAALGLDELSFRGANSNLDGTTSAAAVTLGKRLSSNFYVAYERSVAGTLGTVYVFYDLSRRFTLRAQTGEQSAIDLIFTVPYD